jgi:hypothetical protein
VKIEHKDRARCAQAELILRVCNLREGVKDCCYKVSAQSLKFQILGNTQELSQGVRAGVFLKTRVVEEAQKNLCFKIWKKVQQCWLAGGLIS